MKVKIFEDDHERYLEERINEFIKEIEKEYEVVDIKYSSNISLTNGCGKYSFSALIMYQPKLVLTLEDYENGKCDEKVGKMVDDWIRQERNTKIFKSNGVPL